MRRARLVFDIGLGVRRVRHVRARDRDHAQIQGERIEIVLGSLGFSVREALQAEAEEKNE